jgi:hypothetical protein
VIKAVPNSNTPVDKWVATSRGSNLVWTTSIPNKIWTATIRVAATVLFLKNLDLLDAYAAVAKTVLAVITATIL